MKSRKPFPTALVALLVVFTRLTLSQTSSTSLRGTVTDPSSRVVPNATVVLTDTASKTQRTMSTGGQGEYQFMFLAPGAYTLTVTAPGFGSYEQTRVELLVNTPATANVQLKIGKTTEIVTVSSEAPA